MAKTQGKEITGHMAYCIAAKKIRCKTTSGKLLLLYYCINADETGWFFKSYEHAVLETGISKSTIQRLNKAWEKLKLLTTTEPEINSGKATEYQLHLLALQAYASAFYLSKEEELLKLHVREQGRERQRKWREKHPKHESRNPLNVMKKALNDAAKK